MPTILDLCGFEVPEGIGGLSLKAVLQEGAESNRKEVVTNCASIPIQRMYIKDDWALVDTIDKSIYEYLNTYELFNLATDKEQERDLASEEPEGFVSIRLALDDWLDEELAGRPDRLRAIALRGGGWMCACCIRKAFLKNPALFMENERMREIILGFMGRGAVDIYKRSKRRHFDRKAAD
jgi:hypothetical protein